MQKTLRLEVGDLVTFYEGGYHYNEPSVVTSTEKYESVGLGFSRGFTLHSVAKVLKLSLLKVGMRVHYVPMQGKQEKELQDSLLTPSYFVGRVIDTPVDAGELLKVQHVEGPVFWVHRAQVITFFDHAGGEHTFTDVEYGEDLGLYYSNRTEQASEHVSSTPQEGRVTSSLPDLIIDKLDAYLDKRDRYQNVKIWQSDSHETLSKYASEVKAARVELNYALQQLIPGTKL